MSTLPPVAVLIPTFNRLQILMDSVESLSELIKYEGKISYYIGVDGDRDTTGTVAAAFLEHLKHIQPIMIMDGPRRRGLKMLGYLGANLNMLYRMALNNGHELFIQMDDDHQLVKALDLLPHVEHLMNNPEAGWIRLMGVGFHKYCGCLKGQYWYVNWDSPECYIPSNRPHIKHKRFHDAFGLYPENLKLGATEESFCMNCKDVAAIMPDAPHVLVPITVLTEASWQHVGVSLQNTGVD